MKAIWQRISDWWALVQFGPGNCGVTIKTEPEAPGSLEFRAGALGNSQQFPWWRVLFQIFGGIELQNSSDENFPDAFTVIALGAQRNTSLGVAAEGINIDVNNLNGAIAFRGPEDAQGNRPVLGKIRLCDNGANGFQMIVSIRDNTGTMRDCLILDPSVDASGALATIAGGSMHRLRRTAEGNATLA